MTRRKQKKRRQLLEVKRLRYQFWPPERKIYTTLPTTEDKVITGFIDFAFTRDDVLVCFNADCGSANWPTFSRDFSLRANAIANATEAIAYANNLEDVADLYFENLAHGDMSEKEFAKWVKDDLGLPLTSGRYLLKWKKPEIPELLVRISKGLSYEKSLRVMAVEGQTTLDSAGGKWV